MEGPPERQSLGQGQLCLEARRMPFQGRVVTRLHLRGSAATWGTRLSLPMTDGGSRMWAQRIMRRLKRENKAELPRLYEELRATEQPGSGPLRTTAFRDQNDP